MAHVNPGPTNPVSALVTKGSSTEAHSRWHGRTNSIWENVLAHGATGDGTTDDATAIQAAIDAAELTGGTVFFPPGIYIVGTELVVDTYSVKVMGAGQGSMSQATGPILRAKTGSALRSVLRLSARFLTVDGIIVDGNDEADAGILCHDAGRSVIKDVGIGGTNVAGILFDISPSGLSTGNNNSLTLYSPRCILNNGIGLGSPEFQTDNNAITIFSPTCTNNTGDGMHLTGTTAVFGGHFEANTGYGIRLGSSAAASTSVGIEILYPHIEGNTAGGILAEKCSRCMSWRPFTSGQGVMWADSTTPTGITELTGRTGGGLTMKAAAETFSTEFHSGGIIRTNTDNPDLTFTPDSTGRIILGVGAKSNGDIELDGALNHDGSTVGFYGGTPVAKQTSVPVTAAGVHAALVNLGLISA